MVERGGGGEKRKRLPANPTILENSGVCGQAVPSFPFPSPVIHFFLLLSQLSRRTSQGYACYAG